MSESYPRHATWRSPYSSDELSFCEEDKYDNLRFSAQASLGISQSNTLGVSPQPAHRMAEAIASGKKLERVELFCSPGCGFSTGDKSYADSARILDAHIDAEALLEQCSRSAVAAKFSPTQPILPETEAIYFPHSPAKTAGLRSLSNFGGAQ